MRLILVGPPGAGKGTQAARLAERHGVVHVATGDLLRFSVQWKTDIGREAKQYMDAGMLVPDDLVLELLRRRLSQSDAQRGYVLDGFPRNPAQADALDKMMVEAGQHIDAVVAVEVPDETIVQRLSARWTCPTCQRTFQVKVSPPAGGHRCPDDGDALFQREDDRPEVIRARLGVFREQTEPLVAHYEEQGLLGRVSGVGTLDEVAGRILAAVQEVRAAR